jgi:hypothetical protein
VAAVIELEGAFRSMPARSSLPYVPGGGARAGESGRRLLAPRIEDLAVVADDLKFVVAIGCDAVARERDRIFDRVEHVLRVSSLPTGRLPIGEDDAALSTSNLDSVGHRTVSSSARSVCTILRVVVGRCKCWEARPAPRASCPSPSLVALAAPDNFAPMVMRTSETGGSGDRDDGRFQEEDVLFRVARERSVAPSGVGTGDDQDGSGLASGTKDGPRCLSRATVTLFTLTN